MRLKGLETHGLCDSCGSFVWLGAACIRKGCIFCNVPCSVHRTIVWRCSECNKPLSGIADHWTTQGDPAFVSVYCSTECKRKSLERSCGRAWVPVDARLPEFDIPVLICIGDIPNQLNGPRVKAGLYLASLYGETGKEHLHRWGLQSSGFVSFECVTHWQPLPEPPIVEQVRAFGFCKDCRHWGRSSKDGIYGRCDVLSQYQEAHGWIHTDGPIGTCFNFGCVAFLPREGEE